MVGDGWQIVGGWWQALLRRQVIGGGWWAHQEAQGFLNRAEGVSRAVHEISSGTWEAESPAFRLAEHDL